MTTVIDQLTIQVSGFWVRLAFMISELCQKTFGKSIPYRLKSVT